MSSTAKSGPAPAISYKHTMKEIKDALRDQGKATNGTKIELIDRYYDDDAPRYQGPGRPKMAPKADKRDVMKDFKKRAAPTPSPKPLEKYPFPLSEAQMREKNLAFHGTIAGPNNKTVYCYDKNKPAGKVEKAKGALPADGDFVVDTRDFAQHRLASQRDAPYHKALKSATSPKEGVSPLSVPAHGKLPSRLSGPKKKNKKKRRRAESESGDDLFTEEHMVCIDRALSPLWPKDRDHFMKLLQSTDTPKAHEIDWAKLREFSEVVAGFIERREDDASEQSDDEDEDDADFEAAEEEEGSESESGAESDDEEEDM